VDRGQALAGLGRFAEGERDGGFGDLAAIHADDDAGPRAVLRFVARQSDHRAVGVAGDVHRGGTGDQVAEPGGPVCPDDDSVGVAGRFNQCGRGGVVDHFGDDAQFGMHDARRFVGRVQLVSDVFEGVTEHADLTRAPDTEVTHRGVESADQANWCMATSSPVKTPVDRVARSR